jgi:hypothetical protein
MDGGRDTAKWEFGYWAGTLEQLVRAARHAADEVAALVPFPEGSEPKGNVEELAAWSNAKRDAEEARQLSITVAERERALPPIQGTSQSSNQ